MNTNSFKQFVLDKQKDKHRGCGKCQKRWKSVKNNVKSLQQAPKFLENQAQQSGEVKDLLDMLWGEK